MMITTPKSKPSSRIPRGSGGGAGPGGGGHTPKFATRVTFRKASCTLQRGQIKSSMGRCRAGRTVILWRGNRRIASTKSKAGGNFSFARTASVRGRAVRASTLARSMQAGACAAACSVFIKG